MSHRFDLLTGPLDVTGYLCGFFTNPYWLVTVSGFQGSGAARRYITDVATRCQSLFSTNFGTSCTSSEMQNAPAVLAGGVGTVPMYQHCWSGLAIRSPSWNLVLSRRARLRRIGTSSFDKLPPPQGACKGVWKVLQKSFAREPISPRSVRNGACPPAVRDPQARSRTRRTHPGRGPPALHRSSPHPP